MDKLTREEILLTDEETIAGVNLFGYAQGGTLVSLNLLGKREYRGVMLAQAHKLMEWLGGLCQHIEQHPIEKVYRRECFMCWQELKEALM